MLNPWKEDDDMTIARALRMTLLLLLCTLATGTGPRLAAAEPRTLEGAWAMTAVATSPPGLPPLDSLITFTRGGEVIESRRGYLPFSPFGPILETAGHGVWSPRHRGESAATFTFLVQAAPDNPVFVAGEPLGTDTIRLRLTLDHSGDGFSGSFVSEARDAGGVLVFSASGTVVGTRLRLAPLP
jgi:hypothetical protein